MTESYLSGFGKKRLPADHVSLVKEYGPVEQGWESPEDIAESHPITDEFLPSIVVEPGKTRSSTPTEGSFDKMKGRAYLRVYLGTPA